MSVGDNHNIAILKVKKSDSDQLFHSLSDIIQEAKDLQCITSSRISVQDTVFLGRGFEVLGS